MGILGTNSQGIATSVLAQWVTKVSDLPLPEADKEQLDTVIDDLYAKVGECKLMSALLQQNLYYIPTIPQLLANS